MPRKMARRKALLPGCVDMINNGRRAGAAVPGGRPNAEPGGGRASGAAQRRRLDPSTAQFGTQSIIGVAVPVAVGL
jgi:hypothetical protein